MAGSMVYRLRVVGAQARHMVAFREGMAAIQAIGDNRGFNYIAGFHGAPGGYCWHHQKSSKTPTPARLFLPWHRAYLWWLEQALLDQRDGAALPWWDWTRDRDIPAAYRVRRIGNVPNPLFSFRARVPTATPPINHMTTRQPGPDPFDALPTADDVADLLDDSDFASFSDRLEDFHDGVHGWMGGDMGRVATAAFDPIFWAHHCQIDRIWYLWQVRYGLNRIPRGLLDLPLVPFGKRVRDVLDVQQLGYEYADSSVGITRGGR
jgi:tyrosinase